MDSGRFSFDDFLLDANTGELRRGGIPVEIRPKLFALLAYFVENADRLLEKHELISAVWADVHVGDGSLNRAVTELRDLLGDDPKEPRLIQTVPKRGYRFVAAVSASASTTEASRTVSQFMVVHHERTFRLFEGENIVGRTPDCEVQIVAGSVSRRHARIFASGGEASIEDLGSTNGTFIDDEPITSITPLGPGRSITIGREKLRLITASDLHASTEKIS